MLHLQPYTIIPQYHYNKVGDGENSEATNQEHLWYQIVDHPYM